jgi:ElaA protein
MIQWRLKTFAELSNTELYELMRLRQEVFIVEQNCPYLDADNKDLYCHHLLGYIENNLAAHSRLVPAGVSYTEPSIGRVVTSPKYRGKEYGKLLMHESLAAIEKMWGKVAVRIGAQQYLQKFYEGFGFVWEGEPYLEDGIPHIIMLRKG